MSEEKYQGEVREETIHIENKPNYLDIIAIHLDGNLLILEGMINRYGKTKNVLWVYKRIKG